jgi:hypothetical protein
LNFPLAPNGSVIFRYRILISWPIATPDGTETAYNDFLAAYQRLATNATFSSSLLLRTRDQRGCHLEIRTVLVAAEGPQRLPHPERIESFGKNPKSNYSSFST